MEILPATNDQLLDKTRGEQPTTVEKRLHKTVKKVGEDIGQLKFNTAISALMILFREMENTESVSKECAETFLKLLAPFAPFVTEEIWQVVLAYRGSVHTEAWPIYRADLAKEETVSLAVQCNGKFRGALVVYAGISEAEVISKIRHDAKLQKYIDAGRRGIVKTFFVQDRLINIIVE